jgi:hypothetical protein
MKCGAQAALALGAGYVLGRRRKMRLAAMLAAGAATGGLAKLGPVIVRQGAQYLNKTDIASALGPQVGEIVDTIRGDLLDAGKAAAAAAVTSRIDSLTDSLHERADTLRNPEAAVGDATETVGRAGQETVGRVRRRGRGAGTDAEEDGEERRNGRSGRERPRAGRSTRSEPDEPQDEYEEPDEDAIDESPADEADDFDEEDAQEAAPRRSRTSRSPVTRARR